MPICFSKRKHIVAYSMYFLTYWGRDKRTNIWQTTFSSTFPLMKMLGFRLIFHWSLFLTVDNKSGLVQVRAWRFLMEDWKLPTLQWSHNERDGVSTVCLTVSSDANQGQYQSSASLVFVRGIHRWPVNSPHKGPITRKMFPFDDVIIIL